jgi:4-nitrophenyl phosphatase
MDYEGAVLDLDGTVYRGDSALPGAVDTIDTFRQAGIDTLFFSNNPTKTREAYASRLRSFGISTTPDRILSAGTITKRVLESEHGGDNVFLIGAEGLRSQLESTAVTLVDEPTDADVLVVSWTNSFAYDDMLAGYRALKNGATFYGTDPDRLIPASDGIDLGSGSIINAVGGTMNQAPTQMLGKPSSKAQKAVLETLGVSAGRCFVVGDRLNTDIELGARAGMTTVLVRTGITDDAMLEDSDVRPDHVVDSIADVLDVLDVGV